MYLQNKEIAASDLSSVALAVMFSCAEVDYGLEAQNVRRLLNQGIDVIFIAHTPHAVRESFLLQYGLRFDRMSKTDRIEGVCPGLRGLSVRWNPMGCGRILDENAGWQRMIAIGDDPRTVLLAVRHCGKARLFFLANTNDLHGNSVDFAWWNRVLRGLGIALKTRQPAEKRRNIDPERLADPDATRATQKALDALFPGWKVSTVLPDNKDTASWAFGYQKNWRGRNDVVTTMPVNGEKPCVLSRKVQVTGKHPVLLMEVASQNWDTDFLLSVRVNRKTVLDRRLICTPDDTPYERIQVPLSQWKGMEIAVEIEHCCNGWYYEHAFWGRLEIVEGTGKETCGPAGIASTEVFPRANLKNKKWMKRTPWSYTVREPPENWKDADFDDSRWKHTKKALGFDKGPVMAVADEWHADRIWIRRKFNWSSAQPFYRAVFDLCYDQDIEIFLNGVCISKMGGWNGSWTPYAAWSMRVAEALRKGENILAITLKGDGASYFDCGLTIETRRQAAGSGQ